MKKCIIFLAALVLLCCLLPAHAGPFQSMPTSVVPPEVFSPSDLVGTWYIHEIYVDSASDSSLIQWGMIEIADDGSATAYVAAPDGNETYTFMVTINGAGEISFDGVRKAVMSYDKTQIIGSELVETHGGLFIGERGRPDPQVTQADCEGTWRVHSLQAGSDWEGWRTVDGAIDATGEFTGAQSDSDGGSSSYSAAVTIDTDGNMSIAEPDNSMVQNAGMSSSRLGFSCVMGVNDETNDIGRFDIAVRTGGDFITEDLAGKWWFETIDTGGNISYGYLDCQPDGTVTGQSTYPDSSTEPIEGSMAVTSGGVIGLTDAVEGPKNGQGTLSLDRSFFVFTETLGTIQTMMLATKHPTQVTSTVDLTQISMNWGNGFSFNDPFDLDNEGALCGMPGLFIHPSYFQQPPPPEGTSALAGYVYDNEPGAQSPVLFPGGLTFQSGLAPDGSQSFTTITPALSLPGITWPARNGDLELQATFDNATGDTAPQLGNGVAGVGVGFSVFNGTGEQIGHVQTWFGLATFYLRQAIGGLPTGYHNRLPCVKLESKAPGLDEFTVNPAVGYDPAQSVSLRLQISTTGLAHAYLQFGQGEWIGTGEMQLDFWPPMDTQTAGCETIASMPPVWFVPYIRSEIVYVDVAGEETSSLLITTTSLPDGMTGEQYEQTLEATGGEPPYNWQIVSGSLPPGMSLSEQGGLSGTCYDPGIYTFTVSATDSADPSAADQQELTLTVNENLYSALAGEWRFHGITVDKATSAANTFYGSALFDMEGNVTVHRFELDGTYMDFSFPCSVTPDGQITVDGSPFGTLSFDGKLIVANGYTDDEGTLSIFTKASDGGDSLSQFDAEGDWAVHSFEVGPDWQGWMAMFGSVDESGSFYGSQTDSDGGSDSYEATIAMEDDPPSFTEPDNSLLQHFGMTGNRLAFSTVMGDMADPGIGRFDVGIRAGGDFLTEDLEGKWWFYGISNSGSVFRGWLLVDSEGTATGESFDSYSETTEQLSGTLSVTNTGEITIEMFGETLDGYLTLSMDRSFFAGTSSDGDDRSIMVATKRVETIASQVDVTHVYMDWGNGFGFDDPLTLDVPGTPCDITGITVDDSYFTHPELPQGGLAAALYAFPNEYGKTPPSFEDGKLVFTSLMPSSGDETTSLIVPGIALNNVPWEPQTDDMELRATFENLQGHLTTLAGYGGVSMNIGFRVEDGENSLEGIQVQLGLLTAYFQRSFSGVDSGYCSRMPYAAISHDMGDSESFEVSPIDGYDPSQPAELRLIISPSGYASASVRFGSSEVWTGIGETQLSYWPGPQGWTNGCYSPTFPEGDIRIAPYVSYRLETIEVPGAPHIMPESLPNGILGDDYEQQLYSEDGFPPFQWWIANGNLPPGLGLDENGLISGTLNEAGSYQFTVRVEDGQIPSAGAEREYTIVVIEPVTIQDAKALPDGSADSLIALSEVVVTRKVEDGFYVEDPNRSAGILIQWTQGFVAEGWTVNVEGWVCTTDDGEKSLQASAVNRIAETIPMAMVIGDAVRPVGMCLRNLGGRDFAVDPEAPTSGQAGVSGGAGLNNIGLLVKTWGRVTQIDPGKQYFYIEDGSAVMDGTQTDQVDNEGVRVMQDPLGLRPGDYVTVTGISSCFREPTGAMHRALRASECMVHFPGAPEFVLGTPGESPDARQIIFSSIMGAAGYRLYQSMDGEDYTAISDTPMMQDNTYGVFVLPVTANTYFQVCALDGDGDEGAHSQTVYARVEDPPGSFTLTAPPYGQTDAPLNPSVCWGDVPGALRVGVEIYHEDGSHQTDWGAFFPADEGCVAYGQAGKPITYAPAFDVLQPFTDYWAYAYAVDSGNWSFASSEYRPFRTGDGDGGGGDDPPPL